MKKITASLAFLLAGLSACADMRTTPRTVSWTGAAGDGRWSNAANWADGVGPVDGVGDTLVFDATDGNVATSNDVPGISVAQIRFHGYANTVTLDGGQIVLTDRVGWTNGCPAVVNAPVRHDAARREGQFWICSDLTFNGTLSFGATTNMVFSGHRSNPEGKNTGNILHAAFRGEVDGPGTTVQLYAANSNAGYFDFYGKVKLDCLRNARNWGGANLTLHNPANEIGSMTLAYITAFVESDALHGSVLVSDGYYREGRSLLRFTAGQSYVADRISETGTLWENANKPASDYFDTTSENVPTELVLRGTDNASTAVRLDHAISLTWDPVGDYVQEFRNRVHEMTGDLVVKGGTLRLAGSNVFRNVKKVMVASGARLEIASVNELYAAFPALCQLYVEAGGEFAVTASGARAFSADSVGAVFASGARLNVAAGSTVSFGRLFRAGEEVPASTSVTGDWISGGGTVQVSGRVTTARRIWWKTADGDWSDPSNWLGGVVPGATDEADVTADGTYRVNFRATDVAPKTLRIASGTGTAALAVDGTPAAWSNVKVGIGRGGVLEIPAGAKLACAGATDVSVGGGTVRVVGELALDAYTGSFQISGLGDATGRVEVASGLLSYTEGSERGNHPVVVQRGGVLELAGTGRFEMRSAGWHGVALQGGRFIAADTAAYDHVPSEKSVDLPFGTGETVFSGQAYMRNANSNSSFLIGPDTADAKTRVAFRDQANLNGGTGCRRYDSIAVGNRNGNIGGEAELDLDSDVDYRAGNPDRIVCYGMRVGSPNGTGTVNLRRGYLHTAVRGVRVGTSNGGRWGTFYSGGDGTFNMLGGALNIPGGKVGEGTLDGLTVGHGAAWDAAQAAAKNHGALVPWKGRYFQSGGVVTNEGNTCVGGPRATGRFELAGGKYWGKDADHPFLVGVGGGRGDCLLGGGTFDVRADMYVGGVHTNAIPHGGNEHDLVAYGWPLDDRSAVGTLTVTGGTVTLAKNLIVGLDGSGTVAVAGAGATFSVGGNLVLHNGTEPATASTLRFSLGENGVATMRVAGSVVNEVGTRVEIDLGAYAFTRARQQLISYSSWEGPIPTDVTVTGDQARLARVTWSATGLDVSVSRGTVLTLR